MGLAIKGHGGKSIPVLTCDYCGDEIEKLEDGIITSPSHPEESRFSPVHIYHKGKCDQKETYSDSLSEYLPWLLWNHDWGKKHKSRNGLAITVGVPQQSAWDIMPQLLTITEAAIRVNVSRETIYQWIKSKKIRPVKTPGGRYRIPEGQLTVRIREGNND